MNKKDNSIIRINPASGLPLLPGGLDIAQNPRGLNFEREDEWRPSNEDHSPFGDDLFDGFSSDW